MWLLKKTLQILTKIQSLIPSPKKHLKAYLIATISLVGFIALAGSLIFIEMRTGHSRGVTSVCFSPDGRLVASTSYDNTIRIWNIEAKTNKKIDKRGVNSIAFSSDGKKLFSITHRTIDTWQIENKSHLQTLDTGEYSNACFDVSLDGCLLVASYNRHALKLLDAHNGECFKILKGHYRNITSVKFSPDNKIIASADSYGEVKLWDVATGNCLKTIDDFSRGIECVCFSPDNKYLACGEEWSSIKIWDMEIGKLCKQLNVSSKSTVFSPDGQTIASACGRSIKITDIKTGEVLQAIVGHSDNINSIVFSPDGKFLASGSRDTTVRIWDIKTGRCIKKFGSIFWELYH